MLYNLTATKEEIQDLVGLIDAGLRATGLRAAKAADRWADKLQSALNKDVAIVGTVTPNKESAS